MKLTGLSSGELRQINGKTYKYDYADVCTREGNYIADAFGVICGYTAGDVAYYFKSYTPSFGIAVVSCDGEFVYIGSGEDIAVGKMTETHYSFEETECGLMLGTLTASISSGEISEYYPVTGVKYDGETTTFDIHYTPTYPESGLYPITTDDYAIYSYEGADMAISNTGLVFWQFPEGFGREDGKRYCRVYYDKPNKTLLSTGAAVNIIDGAKMQ